MNGCLLAIMLVCFLLNFYQHTLFYRPISVHQWRQADCLSITKNYYEEGMHFFQPKIHSLRAPGGRAVSECPILNYTVAGLWKIFGEHEFIYRLLEYIIYLSALFALFNTLLTFFKGRFLPFILIGLLLTSPLLTYYSFNFLSDVPALSFCILSFCLAFYFYKTKRAVYFYAGLLIATLAVLLKASALIGFVMLGFLALIEVLGLNRYFKMERLFKNRWLPITFVLLALIIIKAWYSFALEYNTYNNGFFLLTILPIWEMAENQLLLNLKALFGTLFPSFLNRPMLVAFFCMVLFVLVHFKKIDTFLRYSFVFAGLFFLAYIIVFFQVFNVHDYYLANLFIFPVICGFCIADVMTKLDLKFSKYFRIALIITFVLNAFYAAAFYRIRMIKDDKMCVWYPFMSPDEVVFFDNMLWYHKNMLQPIENLRPELRSLGLNRYDSVLCVTDLSPNINLYFMDQKGYSFSNEQFMNDSLSLQKFLPRGIKYLVITDTSYTHEKPFKIVANNYEPIFQKGPIEIFKLKH